MWTSGFWNTIDGCFHFYMEGGRCCPRYEQSCGQRWKAEGGGGVKGGKGEGGGKGGGEGTGGGGREGGGGKGG